MDEQAEVERLLRLLEHGTRQEQIEARAQLGRICEQRGMWDYAAECYEENIRLGVRDPGLIARLGLVYLRQRHLTDAGGAFLFALSARLLTYILLIVGPR